MNSIADRIALGGLIRFVGGPKHNQVIHLREWRRGIAVPESDGWEWRSVDYALTCCISAAGTAFFEYHAGDAQATFRNWPLWDRYDLLRCYRLRVRGIDAGSQA